MERLEKNMVYSVNLKTSNKKNLRKKILQRWQLYLLFLVPLIYLLVFKYYPMLGIQIAFKNYKLVDGIWGSEWVGFKHFERFFTSYQFTRVLKNTLSLSIYSLIAGFPFPIILALSLNYVTSMRYKKTVQMVTYAPHFISVVVMVGIILQFLNPRMGMINKVIVALGGKNIDFMGVPEYFSSIYVWSGIWQNVGYGSIIYMAALSGINPELHEAAIVDGANIMKRIWYIDLPGIMPTAVILLIMNTGHILNADFQKVLLMQNSLNLRNSEIIDTLVYKIGLAASVPNFSYATAVGLFKSLVGLILLTAVNAIAKKLGETSLW